MSIEDSNYAGQRYDYTERTDRAERRRLTPDDEEWENLTPLGRKIRTHSETVLRQLGEMGLTLEDVFDRRKRPGLSPEYYADPFKAEESDR